MFDRIKALIARWQELKEIEALTDRDLADLGMSRAQVEAFARMPHDVPDRVTAMAAIFGLSETDIRADHGRWLELLETCGQCGDRGACALVLERGELSRPHDCSFCLNAGTFNAQCKAAA